MHVWRPGPSQAAKVSVQLVDKLTPIITNGWFWECDQDRLPPQHGNVREVRHCVRHSLAVSHKLTRPLSKAMTQLTIKGRSFNGS